MSPSQFSNDQLLRALQTAGIPSHPYVQLPGLSVSPSGLLYIALPAPHAHVCLTPYILPRVSLRDGEAMSNALETEEEYELENDAEARFRLYSQPEAAVWFGSSTSPPDSYEEQLVNVQKEVQDPRGWRLPVLRLTADVVSSARPSMIGLIEFKRAHELLTISRLPHAWDGQPEKPDREVHWSLEVVMDRQAGGKGVMTAALSYVIDQFFAPYIHTFPGQLVSVYHSNNSASAALHKRVGLKALARSPARRQDTSAAPSHAHANETISTQPTKASRQGDWTIWTVWQGPDGSMPVTHDQSMFREFEAYNGE